MKKVILVFLAISSFCNSANAASVNIDFSSSLSSQGWSAVGATSYITQTATAINGDSMNLGWSTHGGYQKLGEIGEGPWELSWNVALIDYQNLNGAAANGHGGLTVLAHINGLDIGIQYGPDNSVHVLETSSEGGQYITLAATQLMHNYKLAFTPEVNTGLGQWEFYFDSVLISTGTGRVQSRPDSNSLYFGDGASGANAEWQLSYYAFTQTSAVPLPTAIYGFGSALMGLLFTKRKRLADSLN